MGNSFQEQLLKAGLVDKKQVNKAKQEKRVKRKKNKGKAAPPKINTAQQERLAQEKANKEQNQQRNLERLRQESLAQVKQLVADNALEVKDGHDPYYFAMGKKIKKLWVTPEITQKLSQGKLAIVTLDDRFDIVPARIAKQIADRSPEAIAVLHDPENDESS